MALDIDITRINEPVLRDLAKRLADDADQRGRGWRVQNQAAARRGAATLRRWHRLGKDPLQRLKG